MEGRLKAPGGLRGHAGESWKGGRWLIWRAQDTWFCACPSSPFSQASPLGLSPSPLYLLRNPSPAMPLDDFSLVATKKCSYQQTDGG